VLCLRVGMILRMSLIKWAHECDCINWCVSVCVRVCMCMSGVYMHASVIFARAFLC
jgi:hypothetical protein